MRRRLFQAASLAGDLALLAGCGVAMNLATAPIKALVPQQVVVVQPQPVVVQPETNNPTISGATLSKSVVRVVCIADHTVGTGFLHESATIITAGHLIARCKKNDIKILFPDGTQTEVTKGFLNKTIDLAVLYPQISLDGRDVIILSSSDTLSLGEQISFWGFPAGIGGSSPIVTTGIISGLDENPVYSDRGQVKPFGTSLWILNAGVNPGNSGSPVIRVSEGRIIGVVVSKLVPSADIGYVVPVSAVRAFLKSVDIDP